MKAKRVKVQVGTIGSREAADRVVREVAMLTILVDADRVEMDDEVRKVKDRFAPRIREREGDIGEKSRALAEWAEKHPEEFNGKRSIETEYAVWGFRMGNPKLETLPGWTWKKALEAVQALWLHTEWIRRKEELDRERILGDARGGMVGEKDLKSIGLEVVQAETFFVDPKREALVGRVVNDVESSAE